MALEKEAEDGGLEQKDGGATGLMKENERRCEGLIAVFQEGRAATFLDAGWNCAHLLYHTSQ